MLDKTTTIPLYSFGRDGRLLNLALANGFSPHTYQPLIDQLGDNVRAVSVLPRALWPDTRPPARRVSWRDMMVDDLLDGMREHQLTDVIGMGHSFGAVITLLAAIREPVRFRALILLDPTILPRHVMWGIRIMNWLGRDSNPMASRAEKRRDHFDSVETATAYFRSKKLFTDWPDETLQCYVESLLPAPQGGLTLAWPREWEAYYFRTIYTGTWSDLPRLHGKFPILTVRGGTSDTLLPGPAALMRRILPDMTYTEIPQHGHLFPLSAPAYTGAIISEWLQSMSIV